MRAGDPWWATHYPPNGWNCKCEANSYGEKDLHERGWQEMAAPPPSPTYSYVNPRTGATSEIPVGIDPGFVHNPGIAGIQFAAEQALKEKLAITDRDIARAVESLKAPQRKTFLEQVAQEWESAPESSKRLRDRMLRNPGAKQMLRRLGPHEFEATVEYTESPNKFNRPLRERKETTDEALTLARALLRLPPFAKATWRGEPWTYAEALERYKPGSVFFDYGFYSSSTSLARARSFAGKSGTILEIRGKSGRWIKPISAFQHEREVLFAPAQAFRVKSVRKMGRRTYVIVEEL